MESEKVDLNDPLIPKEEQKLSEEELERLERLQTRTRALEKHSVLYYLILNALSMIAMGVINFHFKLMKRIIGLQNYDEYSFSIWRSFWTMTIDIIALYCMKETTAPFSKLKGNVWFWIRNIVQFVTLVGVLFIIIYFRVSTATCFCSMAPVVIVIMASGLLGEKFYMRYLYGILICVGGQMLIVKNEYYKNPNATPVAQAPPHSPIINFILGCFWGVVELVAIAFQSVSSKQLMKQKFDMHVQLIWPNVMAILMSMVCLPLEGKYFKYNFGLVFHSAINSILFLISQVLFLESVKGVDLNQTVALTYLQPVSVFILGAMFLGESFYPSDVIGSLIILIYNIWDTYTNKE